MTTSPFTLEVERIARTFEATFTLKHSPTDLIEEVLKIAGHGPGMAAALAELIDARFDEEGVFTDPDLRDTIVRILSLAQEESANLASQVTK